MNKLFVNFEKLDIGNYIIRNISEDDYEDIYIIYGDIEVMRYDMNNLLKSLDDAKNNIKLINKAISNKWFIRCAVIDKQTNDFIGTIALHHFEFDKNKVQIGYNLKKSYWGRGIMTNVLNSIIDYLKSNSSIEILEASINIENIASIKLVEKLGFELNSKDNDKLVFMKKLI